MLVHLEHHIYGCIPCQFVTELDLSQGCAILPGGWCPKTLKALLLQKGCLTYQHQGLAKLVETFVNRHQPSMCSDLTCCKPENHMTQSGGKDTRLVSESADMVQQDDTYDHHRRTHPASSSIHGFFVNQHNGAPATINPTSTLDVAMNPVTLLYQLVAWSPRMMGKDWHWNWPNQGVISVLISKMSSDGFCKF